MALPETIAVKYTEEEAEYLSMRPVVRQTFRAAELVDMIVRVSGKDSERVQQILHRVGISIRRGIALGRATNGGRWSGIDITHGIS